MSQQKSSGSPLNGANLDGVLKRFLGLIPDARQITISTHEGAELLSESRMGVNVEDSHTVSSLAPSFNMSVEQSSRLGLGHRSGHGAEAPQAPSPQASAPTP